MAELIVFENDCPTLRPVTDLRPVFDIRSGAVRSLDRLARRLAMPVTGLWVRPYLAASWSDQTSLPVNELPDADVLLLVNGAWVGGDLPAPTSMGAGWVDSAGRLVAAQVDRPTADRILVDADWSMLRTSICHGARLLTYPWQILDALESNIADDLHAMTDLPIVESLPTGVMKTGAGRLRCHDSAVIDPLVSIDTRNGDVVIDAAAHLSSGSVLIGPCYIGPHVQVAPHAAIRGNTAIGPSCKVGGEINGCVFQGYSNKGHGGFVGNSYIGQWVNLGAATNTSNLKNTYGPVRMQLADNAPAQDSGRQFLGTIFGDHVKTGIGTRLSTGTCLGTGSMIACSQIPPKYLPAMSFVTDKGISAYALDKFLDVAERVMHRRDCRLSDAARSWIEQFQQQLGGTECGQSSVCGGGSSS